MSPGIARIQRAILEASYLAAVQGENLNLARQLYPAVAIEVWLDSFTPTERRFNDAEGQPPRPPLGRGDGGA